MSPHTPTPLPLLVDPLSLGAKWNVGTVHEDVALVAQVLGDDLQQSQRSARAAFICRAVNSHEALIAALKACSFRLATVVAATGEFSDVNAKALDAATAALKSAEADQ